jgi:hypothetical protein
MNIESSSYVEIDTGNVHQKVNIDVPIRCITPIQCLREYHPAFQYDLRVGRIGFTQQGVRMSQDMDTLTHGETEEPPES